jgi:hypothetical protein
MAWDMGHPLASSTQTRRHPCWVDHLHPRTCLTRPSHGLRLRVSKAFRHPFSTLLYSLQWETTMCKNVLFQLLTLRRWGGTMRPKTTTTTTAVATVTLTAADREFTTPFVGLTRFQRKFSVCGVGLRTVRNIVLVAGCSEETYSNCNGSCWPIECTEYCPCVAGCSERLTQMANTGLR